MDRLMLTLFGGFGARLSSGRRLILQRRKAQALVAYLALRPGQPCSREMVIDLLWGDLPDDQARHSLRQALLDIRHAIRIPGVLVAEADVLAMNSGRVHVDVLEFERLARQSTQKARERGALLCTGELLAGLSVRAEAFEEWLRTERDRLRQTNIRLLENLITMQTSGGKLDRAVETAQRLLAIDPIHEPAHRALMQLHERLGDRSAALRQYQVCAEALERELGVAPEVETTRLNEALLKRSAPVTVGRQAELVRLRRIVRHVSGGRGQLLVLSGEAGIGKTHLLEELANEAHSLGFDRATGRSYELTRVLAFGPWLDVLRTTRVVNDAELLGRLGTLDRFELARLLPEIGESGQVPTEPPDDHSKLFEAFARLLGLLADKRPLLVTIEDLHWADEISVRLLASLGERLQTSRVLLAATVRDEELTGESSVRRTLDALDGARFVLQPLSKAHAIELIHAFGHAGVSARSLTQLGEKIWELSRGNPFMIVETLRTLPDVAASSTGDVELPQRVGDTVAARLSRLGDLSREMVATAAVIGRDFDFALAHRASGLAERQASGALDELVRRRIVREVDARFYFVHDYIRDVAYGQLIAPHRVNLHRAVAMAIEELYPFDLESHVAALGAHHREAKAWDRAIHYLRRAAAQATERGAFDQAQELFRQAFAALDHIAEGREARALRFDLIIERWTVLMRMGIQHLDLEDLGRARVLAESLADDRRMAIVFARLAREAHSMGDRAAVEQGERAVNFAERTGNVGISAQARLVLAETHYVCGDYDRAIQLLEKNVAELVGEHLYESVEGHSGLLAANSRAILALSLSPLGRFSAALKSAEEAVTLAEAVNRSFAMAAAYNALGIVHLRKGEIDKAIVALERGLAVSRTRVRYYFTSLARELGHAYALAGRLDEAIRLLEQAVQSNSALSLAGAQINPLAHVYTLAGRFDEALDTAQRALALGEKYGHRPTEAWACRLIAENWLRRPGPNPETAIEYDLRGLAITTPRAMKPSMAHSHFGLARAFALAGAMRDAASHLDIARSLFVELGITRMLPQVAQLAEVVDAKA